MDMDDVQLYQRWMLGDRKAGQVLARRHYGGLVRWLVTNGFHDYDDLAQASWMAAQRSGTYSGRGSFKGWLREIARRLDRSRGRAASSRLPHDGAVEELREESKASPSKALLRAEIAQAIDDITHNGTRDTARWRVAGLSDREIAEQTGVGLETVRSRWRLAKEKLRERLGCQA